MPLVAFGKPCSHVLNVTVTDSKGAQATGNATVDVAHDDCVATRPTLGDSLAEPHPFQVPQDNSTADLSHDGDGDGVAVGDDLCPASYDPDQVDLDLDGRGDVCDLDDDGDGRSDVFDLCPRVAEVRQADLDSDGLGDACDPDVDGDGVKDAGVPGNQNEAGVAGDVCPRDIDPGQEDLDQDGIGDVCDPDRDGDGVPNLEDLAPDDPDIGREPIKSTPRGRSARPAANPTALPARQKAEGLGPVDVVGLAVGVALVAVLIAVLRSKR
jgi:hypothetical protein